MTEIMNAETTEIKKKTHSSDHTSPEWKGYNLQELQYRIEINKIKQQIVTERLESIFVGIKENNVARSSGLLSRFNSISSIAEYGIIGFRIFSRLRSLYKSFRS